MCVDEVDGTDARSGDGNICRAFWHALSERNISVQYSPISYMIPLLPLPR